MIAYLEGKVLAFQGNATIVVVAGVGYQVFTSAHLQPTVGSQVIIYCSQQVREDSLTLYGFASWLERSWFELLLSVSGVGPKSALAIVGSNPIEQIERAIGDSQTALFEAVPGIGKKVAAKIIVELKGKVGGPGALLPSDERSTLLDALESLGYKRAEVLAILPDMPTGEQPLEKQLRWALKRLSLARG